MSKSRKGKPLTFDQAASELPAAMARASELSSVYAEAYEQCIVQLRLMHGIMARERAKSKSAMLRVDELRAVVEAGEGKKVIEEALVPNPMITQGLLDAVAEGEVTTQHDRHSGVLRNQVVLVGGLARVKNKTDAQFMAATRYLNLFENAQIGPMKATDYSEVRVDTSGPRQDQVSSLMDFSQVELVGARAALGGRAASIVDQVVVYGMSVRGLCDKLKMGQGGQARRKLEKELLDALDVLVRHFNLLPRDRAKSTSWSDGSKASMNSRDDEVA